MMKSCTLQLNESRMLSRACQIPNIGRRTANIACPLPNISCQMADIGCQMANIDCQMANTGYQMADIDCQMSNISPHMAYLDCQMSNISCQMSDIGCRMVLRNGHRPSVNSSATAILVQWILHSSESPSIQFEKGKTEVKTRHRYTSKMYICRQLPVISSKNNNTMLLGVTNTNKKNNQ